MILTQKYENAAFIKTHHVCFILERKFGLLEYPTLFKCISFIILLMMSGFINWLYVKNHLLCSQYLEHHHVYDGQSVNICPYSKSSLSQELGTGIEINFEELINTSIAYSVTFFYPLVTAFTLSPQGLSTWNSTLRFNWDVLKIIVQQKGY